ncbi:hypothetical protein [Pseudomonas saponiphila]|uniref:hypothetical protein n=1 Tax=Pseudomonas saponiphila TaxID=556534 RepID=UPI00115FDE5D|nr:hypothetical protein [Pseudomonas saponiphila]
MQKALPATALTIALVLSGCSKVDKEICWKQETKDSVSALVSSQSKDIESRIKNFFEFKKINIYFGSIDVNMKTSDYSLEKIDKETEAVECSFNMNIETKFNSSATLQNSGKVRFTSKVGEHGRYIVLEKGDIPPIVVGLK